MLTNSLIHNTSIIKILLEHKIKNGSVVVDATMGNGNDTLFLCQRALPKGKVYAFDIQKAALKQTRALLKNHQYNQEINPNIHCINDSHENFEQYISESVDAFMYNLGYLPGSNKSITTRPESTINSLKSAISLLKVGGIISIVIYYGHPVGNIEKQAIEVFLDTLSNKNFKIFQGSMPYNDHCPPIIYLIEKFKEINHSKEDFDVKTS